MWAWQHGGFHEKFGINDMRSTKYGHKNNVFLEIGRCFEKLWAWEHWFFRWKMEKRHPIDFFGPYSSLGLTELTGFWPNMGTTRGFLIESFKKYDMNALCFWENGSCLTKYGHASSVLFREWTFLTKYWYESSDFIVNNWKKRASLWHFWPII